MDFESFQSILLDKEIKKISPFIKLSNPELFNKRHNIKVKKGKVTSGINNFKTNFRLSLFIYCKTIKHYNDLFKINNGIININYEVPNDYYSKQRANEYLNEYILVYVKITKQGKIYQFKEELYCHNYKRGYLEMSNKFFN